jgi:hypothetical protein
MSIAIFPSQVGDVGRNLEEEMYPTILQREHVHLDESFTIPFPIS